MLEKDLLAYHYGLISGIQRPLKFAPRILTTAMLPCVMFFARELTPLSRSGNMTTKNRLIDAVLFTEMIGMGSQDGGYEKTDPFFSSVEDYFEPRTTLALADGTTDLTHEYMNDEGETQTPYPTGGDKVGQFWTITFKHQFTIVKQVIYKSGV